MKDNEFQFKVIKNNPKPNAERYELVTLEDMFKILTKENHERFISDLSTSIRMFVNLQECVTSIGEHEIGKGKTKAEIEEIKKGLALMIKKFTWIDD